MMASSQGRPPGIDIVVNGSAVQMHHEKERVVT
jgi:hypothetical protein